VLTSREETAREPISTLTMTACLAAAANCKLRTTRSARMRG
jgi:hypothetical protein